MLRALLPLASLLLACFSLTIDVLKPAPGSRACLHGCRFDQLYAAIDTAGMNRGSLSALVESDPANPLVWCTYADQLSSAGDAAGAARAFDRALELGPGMAPVLMRIANFDFSHGRRDHGLQLASRILTGTEVFDQILFSYLLRPGAPVSPLLGSAVPATPRVARSWLNWVRAHGSDQDLVDTWKWMRRQRLAAPESAAGVVMTLWQRKAYGAAQELWADWLGGPGGYPRMQRLTNRHFENAPQPSPLDWTLTPSNAAELTRQDGLNVRFTGKENVDYSHVSQFTTAPPGRYRFSAEVQADGLTTDQRPFFRIFDPAHPASVNASTDPVPANLRRSWISVEFNVPAGAEALEVQLARRPSQRFDNLIAGTLHLYQVSLTPVR